MAPAHRRRRWLDGALPVTIVLYVLAGLYPFDWYQPLPPNAVGRSSDGTLHFTGPAIARTDAPPVWLNDAIRTGQFSVSLRVRSADRHQSGPARLLTVSPDPYAANFTIAQELDDLIVRLRTEPGPEERFGELEWAIPGVFAQPAWHDIVTTVRAGTLRVQVDGSTRLAAPLDGRPLVFFDPSYCLALGNEMTGDRPWRGDIARAEVSTPAQRVDYLRPGQLRLPDRLPRFGHPPQLLPFVKLTPGDAVLNFLGFIPLGVLAGARRIAGKRLVSARAASLLIALVSLLIELMQLGLRSRYPSVDDFMLNCAGGLVGVLIAAPVCRWARRACRAGKAPQSPTDGDK